MTADFPAAHSMDTEWFAADRDGHVARFISAEAGAVPQGAYLDPEKLGADPDADAGPALLKQLAKVVPRTTNLYERTGRVRLGSPDHYTHWLYPYRIDPGLTLMFLWDLDAVKRDLREGRAKAVQAINGAAVIFKNLRKARANQLHDSHKCMGCFWPYDEGGEKPRKPEPAGLGFYSYRHTDPDTITGPYGRTQRPAIPLLLKDIPAPLRKFIAQVRFETLCFAQTPQLQPLLHLPCSSWEPVWLDLDGVTQRCVPGKEKEYRDYYKEFDGHTHRWMEPPP